jgi:hypothetical protein
LAVEETLVSLVPSSRYSEDDNDLLMMCNDSEDDSLVAQLQKQPEYGMMIAVAVGERFWSGGRKN